MAADKGASTIFFSSRKSSQDTSKSYAARLKAAGFKVTVVHQDGEPVKGVYNAIKRDVKLKLEARQSFTADSILSVQVKSGHPLLPAAPSAGGFEKRVPKTSALSFEGAGKNDSGMPQAFYTLDPTHRIDDCVQAFKNAGFTIKQAKQDGEPVKNTWRATKTGKSFTFERLPFFSRLGDLVIATP
ncbi:hypothetical protein ACFV2Z_39990 [Streptomyces sp. NPDC059688]|uniref:hypothetical protein n=1 Tax=Streptomyces sp. NPDC059688 TaxID=3346906 RepID=UPI0036CAF1B2